ncbi:hypothetical protein EV426DRAFT_721050 [Tirmania nivea]|nr:hypothetical protein EV426DRAFT_721050 [Tirmania nivea]
MPRVSQRKALIEWFLYGIERHQAHLDQERFQDFLRRTMRQLQQGLDDAMDIVMGEPRGDDGDNGSSVTLTVTVTLSETEDSDSMSSLLSSKWDSEDDEVDHEREMLWKLRTLRAILAKRYLRERGGNSSIPKSKYWRNEVLGRLPYDRFRHFFGMNLDSFLRILDRIEDHEVFKSLCRTEPCP